MKKFRVLKVKFRFTLLGTMKRVKYSYDSDFRIVYFKEVLLIGSHLNSEQSNLKVVRHTEIEKKVNWLSEGKECQLIGPKVDRPHPKR